jgi:hypothetical protein
VTASGSCSRGAASEWRQAILLSTARPIRVDGRSINRLVVLWEDAVRRTVDVAIEFDGDLCIQNGWETGNGVVKSGRGGAAMIVDETPMRRRYRCNDGYPDDDFDDLVFRIERVSE